MISSDKIVINPGSSWLYRVCEGDKIWLVKEKKEATVTEEYKYNALHNILDETQIGYIRLDIDGCDVIWYTSCNGRGFDGSLLMLPIEDYILSEEEYEIRQANKYGKLYGFTYKDYLDYKEYHKNNNYPNEVTLGLFIAEWNFDSQIIRELELAEKTKGE